MGVPRLIQVACPRCGAGLPIDPRAKIVACQYCGTSSFVHLPQERKPPAVGPGQQGYGHIHVQPEALKALGFVFALSVLGPIVIVVAVVGVVVVGAIVTAVTWSGRRPTVSAPVPATGAPGRPVSPAGASSACARAIACCRAAIQATSKDPNALRGCDGLAALSAAECGVQHAQLKKTAQAVHATCD
jgi:hypothetical protein